MTDQERTERQEHLMFMHAYTPQYVVSLSDWGLREECRAIHAVDEAQAPRILTPNDEAF